MQEGFYDHLGNVVVVKPTKRTINLSICVLEKYNSEQLQKGNQRTRRLYLLTFKTITIRDKRDFFTQDIHKFITV